MLFYAPARLCRAIVGVLAGRHGGIDCHDDPHQVWDIPMDWPARLLDERAGDPISHRSLVDQVGIHPHENSQAVEKSVACWGKAAHRSAARSAMAEAAAQFQKALDQLALLPDTPERQRQELEFCSALGSVLQAVKGFAAPETGHAYARARELWEQLDSP